MLLSGSQRKGRETQPINKGDGGGGAEQKLNGSTQKGLRGVTYRDRLLP